MRPNFFLPTSKKKKELYRILGLLPLLGWQQLLLPGSTWSFLQFPAIMRRSKLRQKNTQSFACVQRLSFLWGESPFCWSSLLILTAPYSTVSSLDVISILMEERANAFMAGSFKLKKESKPLLKYMITATSSYLQNIRCLCTASSISNLSPSGPLQRLCPKKGTWCTDLQWPL